jgi:transcriptional regulator with XRE-family HTH domain
MDSEAASQSGERLKALRKAAGLTQCELAERIGVIHSNINYWESGGSLPRSDVLIPLAEALATTVEQLLGKAPPKRAKPAGGNLGKLFERIAKLPRREQQKVMEFVEAYVDRQTA